MASSSMMPTPQGHPKRIAADAMREAQAYLHLASTALHDANLHELECANDKIIRAAKALREALATEMR